jgi:hypothetical protein
VLAVVLCGLLGEAGTPARAQDTSCGQAARCSVEMHLDGATADITAVVAIGAHDQVTVTVPLAFIRSVHAGLAIFTPLSDGFAYSLLDTRGLVITRFGTPRGLAALAATGALPFATLPPGKALLRHDLASGLLVATAPLARGQLDAPGVFVARPILPGEHGEVIPSPALSWRHVQPPRLLAGPPCFLRSGAMRGRESARPVRRCAPAPRRVALLIPPRLTIGVIHSAANATVTAVVLFPDGSRTTATGRTHLDGSWHATVLLDHRPARADLPATLSVVIQRAGQAAAHAADLLIVP